MKATLLALLLGVQTAAGAATKDSGCTREGAVCESRGTTGKCVIPDGGADAGSFVCVEDEPCFGRDTFAIGVDGESIPMASLKSGDLVMDGPNSVTRVIVNQHRMITFKSGLLSIEHTNGELSLTPEHVLEVDGAFVPARLAAAGSKLGESEVSRVTTKAGEVINPLTTSGKILTQGGVLSSTYPEWVAEYMLSSDLALSVSHPLALVISYLFPESTQAFYDAVVEPFVTVAHPKHLKHLPAALYPVAFLAGDLALSAGFFTFCLASPVGLALAAIAFVALAKRK